MPKSNIHYHQPVMLEESLAGLAIKPDGIYVDITFGGGGHSRAILKRLTTGKLFSFDQDADAAAIAARITDKRFKFIQSNARFMENFLVFHKIQCVHGIIADLGVSSHQIDTAERGFSTRLDGPLDMRMDQSTDLTASYVINKYPYQDLQQIFFEYGELRNALAIVKAIVAAREKQAITTTTMLKDVVLPFAPPKQHAKFLAKVFQALRIEVNNELGILKVWLDQSRDFLTHRGRLVVISYHSLEDKIVKRFIKTGNCEGKMEKDLYGNTYIPIEPVKTKVTVPKEAEIAVNSRARSAKLRVGEKCIEEPYARKFE